MKKILRISGIAIVSLLLIIIAAAVIIPVAFKDKIRTKVEQQVNAMVEATVKFDDYDLSLLRAFPNASFSLEGLSVTGTGPFEGDTLAKVNSFNLVFNLLSIFSDRGYEIKSIIIDKPAVNALVLEDGTANWDIMKEVEAEVKTEEEGEQSAMKLLLREFAIRDGKVAYRDLESGISASAGELGFNLSGNMSSSRTDLVMDLTSAKVNLIMDGIRYLSDAEVSLHAGIDAMLDSMRFILKDNSFGLNDMVLRWSGSVAMPGDDIATDLAFSAPETSFKSLLSLVPAFYMQGYEELKASGTFSLDGTIKGIYSAADSTLPDMTVNLSVTDGIISYPDLPEKISSINIRAGVKADGSELDNTTVSVDRFHFELAGNPFDMTANVSTPISDPAIAATARGKIDLSKLQQAVPLDSITLNGIIDVSLSLAGRMSMIENEKYDQFKAEGALTITGMALETDDLPEVSISNADFTFNPAFAELSELRMKVGEKNDFTISGKLANYIPYIFSDGTISGTLDLTSASVDLNEIMDKIPSDTTTVADTTSLAVIQIPKNIDFTFNAFIGRLVYDRLTANDVKGNIIMRDGILIIRETGMKALGGSIVMNAAYDTRDTLKPFVKADLSINSVGIKEAFNTFNTVRMLAPIAAGLAGNVSVGMKYESLLGSDMMPVISSITGAGDVRSETVQVLESNTFEQVKSVLKLNESYSNTIKDLRASFTLNDGRLFVKPFDTRVGNIKLNIGGDQGLDQTLNYIVKTEIPRSELGGAAEALMGTLAAQAATLGFAFAPPEIIKVNLKIGGTVKKPVITPIFSGSDGAGTSSATVASAVKEEVTQQVTETAREQADRLIKEAEVQAQVIRDEAAVAAKKIRDEAEVQAQKLVKEAEPKGSIALLAARKGADVLRKEADKRASQVTSEADKQAEKIIAEAKAKADQLLK
ncbi:MAG: AsmA family protein [Bacteroidales bacterium]|jgi:hypothetical protein|nr:AsmA family protein [Bacteroidales bacterium]